MLHTARILRFDLLWTIAHLARMVAKWTKACDRKLHRLVSYLHHHQHISPENFVGDYPEDLTLACYNDADFVGDLVGSKSTSGCHLALVG